MSNYTLTGWSNKNFPIYSISYLYIMQHFPMMYGFIGGYQYMHSYMVWTYHQTTHDTKLIHHSEPNKCLLSIRTSIVECCSLSNIDQSPDHDASVALLDLVTHYLLPGSYYTNTIAL